MNSTFTADETETTGRWADTIQSLAPAQRKVSKMSSRSMVRFAALAAAAALALSACGATKNDAGGSSSSSGGGDGKPATGLQLMVPNAPGGGYDTTARTAAKVMESQKITGSVQVFNLPGAGGTVGLQRIVNEKGNGKLAMQMGLGVVGAAYTQKSKATLAETTPIAKLIEEAGAIVVPKDSPYKDINALVAAWKADPKKFAVGGGSSPGGPDHLLPMQLAKTVGIDPKDVNYVTYDGGGELLPALLGNKIKFGASGFGEFLDQVEAGEVRVLAVTSEQPVEALKDVPTLKSAGIDLVFTNWRGIVAPPGISDADKKVWIDALTKMQQSQAWKDEEKKRGWTDAFETGDDFGTFLKQQDQDVADLLKQLGLA
jgi:putative tricarboxylic transport membrane protein